MQSSVSIIFEDNIFTGTIPLIGFCFRNGTYWDWSGSNNELSSTLPSCQFNLFDSFYVRYTLILEYNHISGTIPSLFFSYPHVKYNIYLSSNLLSGSLPSVLNGPLEILDASRNELIGYLPPSLDFNLSIDTIMFDHNHFTGSIPTDYYYIFVMSVSFNVMTGSIPSTLLSSVCFVSMNYNQLSGSIPTQHSVDRRMPLTFVQLSHNIIIGKNDD